MLMHAENEYELIQGREVLMSPAGAGHNLVVFNLAKTISNYLKGKRCKVRLDTFIRFDKDNILAPDISIFCSPFKVVNDIIEGIPDFVAEVLSPSTRKHDIGEKKTIYADYGVKEYWILDPKAQTIEIYLLRDGAYILSESYYNYSQGELDFLHRELREKTKLSLKISLYDDFEINIKDIFEE